MTHAFQEFIRLLQAADKTQLTTFFAKQDTKAQLEILKWLFNQAQQDEANYAHWQAMVEVLCIDTGIPNELIAGINDESRLTFFTPVLLSKEAFAQVNHQGNTVLHILFTSPLAAYPPFNYVRSLLLFERNESLSKALAVRNQQQLTAIEMFFSHRKDLTALPNHELGALLALVEVERKLQITPLKAHLPMIVKHLRKQHKATWTGAEQCHIMLASYYQCPLALVLSIK